MWDKYWSSLTADDDRAPWDTEPDEHAEPGLLVGLRYWSASPDFHAVVAFQRTVRLPSGKWLSAVTVP